MAVSPITTSNAAGNVLSSASLAGGANITATVDFTAKFGAKIQVWSTPGGTVAATNGMQIDLYASVDGTPNFDTVSLGPWTLASVASTVARFTIPGIDTGKYQLKLTNLDATNAITREASSFTIDSVG